MLYVHTFIHAYGRRSCMHAYMHADMHSVLMFIDKCIHTHTLRLACIYTSDESMLPRFHACITCVGNSTMASPSIPTHNNTFSIRHAHIDTARITWDRSVCSNLSTAVWALLFAAIHGCTGTEKLRSCIKLDSYAVR
jgi:hypothetical protein